MPRICVRCGKHWAFLGSDTGFCVYCLGMAPKLTQPDHGIAVGNTTGVRWLDWTINIGLDITLVAVLVHGLTV